LIRLYLWFCRVLFCCTRTMGATGTRSSLRPLFSEEHETTKPRGAIRAAGTRTCIGCLTIKAENEVGRSCQETDGP
jgi:hypothetical protein